MKTKKRKKRQPRLKSIYEFKSILAKINPTSLTYFDQKGLQKFEREMQERRLHELSK